MPHESPPVRISIPNIGVNASIESVGLTEQGAMDVPSDRANAGWFRHGPFPGNAGSAVIAGHYGWKDGKASAFDNLSDLSVGDRIFVEDADGNRTAFVVKRTSRYTPDANTEEVFLSDDGKSYLNLITCDGAWNSAQESYANRLVVFSEREEAVATTVVKKSGK